MLLFDLLSSLFVIIYIVDRIWKTIVITYFFRKSSPPEPEQWPYLSLIQPVTASLNNLRRILTVRAKAPCYPGQLEQIIVCDVGDNASQTLCHELMQEFPGWQPKLVLVESPNGVALKTVKQLAGLDEATGEIFCFIDDDILLRENTLAIFIRYLLQPGVGAVFGLACYTNWDSTWSALMSAFVNANALLNYIPLAWLTKSYDITGHIYALRRGTFESIGGLSGMEKRLDDDHELARRVTRAGLLNIQTPAIYNVDNALPTLKTFIDQMKRWFIFPREQMLPGISLFQQALTFMISIPNLLPGLIILASLRGGYVAWSTLIVTLLAFYIVYFWIELHYLGESTPPKSWLLLLLVAFVLPLQILSLLFLDSNILWRGQHYRVKRGGGYDILSPK